MDEYPTTSNDLGKVARPVSSLRKCKSTSRLYNENICPRRDTAAFNTELKVADDCDIV